MITDIKEQKKTKTVKLRLILLDQTLGWRDDIVKACGKIFTPYMYDANQHTYLCEVTPSYTLYPLPSFSEKKISDEMYDNLVTGDNENTEPIYMHVSDVDARETKEANFSHSLDGGLTYYKSEGKKYRQIIEAAEDYFRGNSPY